MRIWASFSEKSELDSGVHQGLAMNPLLFIIVMEEAAKEHRKEGTWKLLFADDLVLIAESREEVLKMF